MKFVRTILITLAAGLATIALTLSVSLSTMTSVQAAACTSSIGPGIPPPASVPSGIPGFHAAWYGQSGYPTLCPGEKSTATVAYYNSGSSGWVSGRMGEMAFLGTWEPEPGQDRPSLIGGDGTFGSPATNWPRYNRVAAQPAAYVGPNQVSWFQFQIQAPTTPGTYRLYIRPLIEGATWMEDFGVYWQVTVLAGAQPGTVGVSPTDTATVPPGTTRAYTASVTGITGCVDLALVDAELNPADGRFLDGENAGAGDDKADLSSKASFTIVNGASVSGSYIDCVVLPPSGNISFTITSTTPNTFVRPVVFQDGNGDNAVNLTSANVPTEFWGVGGAVRFSTGP